MESLADVLRRFRTRAFAKAVLVVDEDGDLVAGDAEDGMPSEEIPEPWRQQLGSLEGFARLMESPDVGVLFQDVGGQDVHLSQLAEGRALCVVYSQERTSLGLVRLRLKEHREDLVRALDHDDAE